MLAPLGVALGSAAFVGAVRFIDPEVPGRFPTCPWLALTGTYCPGCGTLRCVYALTEGNLALAWHRNPLTVLSLLVMIGGFSLWVRRLWRGEPRRLLAPAWMLYALFWGVLAFWVLRNVPGFEFLGPGI